MTEVLTRLCWPVLRRFERGEPAPSYQPMHRKILWVVAFLFVILASLSLFFATAMQEWGALLPFVIFLLGSLICAIVGLLGSDRAVARLWGLQ